MLQFSDYANIYDLIYKDKDYALETEYVLSVARKHGASHQKQVLELGCGTGNYSRQFSLNGFSVTGLDLSANMIQVANGNNIGNSDFKCADIRHYDLGRKFPLIVSLFHVFSYLNSDEDVKAFFSCAYEHLEDNGLLLFDLWNGPGVMADPPGNRSKEVENEKFFIRRKTTSEHKKEINTVDVHFDFSVSDKLKKTQHNFSELHKMRYFFEHEIRTFSEGKFALQAKYAWLSEQEPDSNNWYALYVLRKIPFKQ